MALKTSSSVLLTEEQKEWIDDNCVNFSKFVRKAVDKAMNKEGVRGDEDEV